MAYKTLSEVLGNSGAMPPGSQVQVPSFMLGDAPAGWTFGGEVLSKTDNAELYALLGYDPDWYDQPVITNSDLVGGDLDGRLNYVLEAGRVLFGFGEDYNGAAAVFRSDDGGLNWTTLWVDPDNTAGSPLRWADYYNGQLRAYTQSIAYKEEIYSTDGGLTWTQNSSDYNPITKTVMNPDTGARYLLSNSTYQYYSSTFGGSWSSRSHNTNDVTRDAVTGKVWIARGGNITASNNDAVGVSTTDGSSFSYLDLPIPTTPSSPNAIVAHDGVIIIGLNANESEVIVSTDDGATWALLDTLPLDTTLYPGAHLNGRFLFRTSNGSTSLVYTDDNGATWDSVVPENNTSLSGSGKTLTPITSVWKSGAFFVMSDHDEGARVTRIATETPGEGEFFFPEAPSFDANARNLIKV